MARTFTMTSLVSACQDFADKTNDTHISTAQWKRRISFRYGELYQIVVDGGGRYFETESSITATGATSYNEPSSILHILEVTRVDGSYRRKLDELMIQERADFMGLTGTATRWEFQDDQIILYPNPPSGTYKVLYIPQATDLSAYADGDLVDVACPAGERFLIWSVVADALAKSESNAVDALRNAAAARLDFEMWAANRALTNPRHRVTRDECDIDRDPAEYR